MAKRGQLTKQIEELSEKLLGYSITQTELRLMPYFQYLATNNKDVSPSSISPRERKVISEWRKKGWVADVSTDLTLSKEFWDAINQLLWLAYVDYENQPDEAVAD